MITAAALSLVITGAPRTKKNSGQGVISRAKGKGGQPCPDCHCRLRVRVYPSKAWRAWEKIASIDSCDGHFCMIADDPYLAPASGRPADRWEPLTHPINCRALFYRDRLAGDFIGYAQGLADVLESRCIIANDSLLVSWNGSQLLVDRQNPRVELVLEPITEEQV